ncbi:hypothetical protein [Methylorubrum extorquens]|jgi:hypothetical protein|uniref:Uncharacterized protein n=1 Tax=Methylorubrum extorquens (strain ATCC 14718 / DSM 1338 / JCM 2805 / NCIMB 9133 / AM1) TaxID=272630 RepID=C5B438_METEA|nr:hypothetical protein [Methylorubrum extorquens]MDV2988408.1 hypothetical protein [Methylobacteriaceae bacterium AG10]MRI57411.1 hypothetical protein [Methylobacterium sp. DB1607]ACS43220.1 conserved hypothetical protein [Methylorubrum extorquens AM1]MCP1545693.1 hypothetical protein [Methylorubrum extorquens]MCP1591644.1 hypothetical protein [Methylorubrum extorquens]
MTDPLRSVGLSRYELNARLKPALLALLPVIIVALFWYPGAWSIVGSVVAAASACGVLYGIAQLARYRGRIAEHKLNRQVGRNHTARLLTHSDETIVAETKVRYHAYLRTHDKVLSTPSEEQLEPELAFRRARSTVDWLLEHTRMGANASLLLDENVAYGFQRNLYGLKPFGIGLCIVALVAHVVLLAMTIVDGERFWLGVAVCGLLFVILFVWLVFVTKAAVAEASLAYAQRLLANCEPPASASRRRPSSSSKSSTVPAKPRKRDEASSC